MRFESPNAVGAVEFSRTPVNEEYLRPAELKSESLKLLSWSPWLRLLSGSMVSSFSDDEQQSSIYWKSVTLSASPSSEPISKSSSRQLCWKSSPMLGWSVNCLKQMSSPSLCIWRVCSVSSFRWEFAPFRSCWRVLWIVRPWQHLQHISSLNRCFSPWLGPTQSIMVSTSCVLFPINSRSFG